MLWYHYIWSFDFKRIWWTSWRSHGEWCFSSRPEPQLIPSSIRRQCY